MTDHDAPDEKAPDAPTKRPEAASRGRRGGTTPKRPVERAVADPPENRGSGRA